MNRKCLSVFVVALLLLGGVAVFAAPTASNASTLNITSVEVDLNGILPGGLIFNVWTPFVLVPTATALLSQTTGAAGVYNFDTSDPCITTPCGAFKPTIKVTLAGGATLTFTDTTNILGLPFPAGDTAADPPRETAGYVFNLPCVAAGAATCADLKLDAGYVDDAHLQAGRLCTDPGADCRPEGHPFTATVVQANAVSGGCLGTVSPCFDAGVLYFTNTQATRVPEPATLILLGAGLLGAGIWGRRLGRI